MRRTGQLIERIADADNLRLAFWKALRGKRAKPEVLRFRENLNGELCTIREQLLGGCFPWGPYRTFVIRDPKERTICAAPFRDRVAQHAIMNVAEPVFESYQIYDSYACRPGKGLDGAITRVDFFVERCAYTVLPIGAVDRPQRPSYLYWLGTDTDGADGWGLRAILDDSWNGSCWRVWVAAFDDQGLSTRARSRESFGILGEEPRLFLAAPSDARSLRDIEPVTVLATQGSQQIRSISLYLQNRDLALSYLGEMQRLGNRWTYAWDTTTVPDGSHALVAVGLAQDRRRVLTRSGSLQVANRSVDCAFRQPGPGETMRGSHVIGLQGIPPEAAIESVDFYYRDSASRLFFVGEDDEPGNGWGLVWNTLPILDGDYTLVAAVHHADARSSQAEVRVQVRNATPFIRLDTPADSRLEGFQRIRWIAHHPLGKPMSVTLGFSPDSGAHWIELASDIPSTESYLWDTRSVPDTMTGLLKATVTDDLYTVVAEGGPFSLDNTNDAPSVTLLSPRPGRSYGGETKVCWEATDRNEDELALSLAYRRGQGAWRALDIPLSSIGCYTWSLATLVPDDNYELRITATDPRGAVSSDSAQPLSISANTPPQVALLWPNDGAHLDRETIILWRAIDPDGDDLLIDLFYSDDAGLTWLPLAEGLENEGYYVWQISFLPAGRRYRVRVVARDSLHETSDVSDGIFRIGDSMPPLATLLSPVPGTELGGVQLVRWSAVDPDQLPLTYSVLVRPAGAIGWTTVVSDRPDDGYYLWDTSVHPDGQYDVRVIIADEQTKVSAGLPRTVTISNHKNHAPRVTLLSPRGGERWAGLHEVTWDAYDPDGDAITATLALSADEGKTWQIVTSCDGGSNHYLWDTSQPPSSDRMLVRLTMSDGRAATTSTASSSVQLINRGAQPPRITLLSSESAPRLLRGRMIEWLAEDAGGAPLSISVATSHDSGATWDIVADGLVNSGEYPLLLANSSLPYHLSLVATNRVFSVRTAPRRFEPPDLPSQAPTVSLVTPRRNQVLGGQQYIRWQATDPGGEPIRVSIECSGDGGQNWNSVAQALRNTGLYRWDTTAMSNGPHLLRLGVDNGRVSRELVSAPFILSNPGSSAPTVSIVYPRGGEIWSGSQEIRWRAFDADGDPLMASLAYRVDGMWPWRPLATAISGVESYVWDTTAAANSERIWLQITVSEGRFTATATSVGTFAIQNEHAPIVRLRTLPRAQGAPRPVEIGWRSWQVSESTRVSLSYSLNEGRSWLLLAGDLPAWGSYLWDPSSLPSGVPIRISALATSGLQAALAVAPQPLVMSRQLPTAALPLYYR